MKRRTISTVFVATLVVLAGSSTLALAATPSGSNETADTTPSFAVQEEENATQGLNVTVETLQLRNVALQNVFLDHVHVIGNVTTEDVTTQNVTQPEPGMLVEPGQQTVENVTANRLFVLNATLENVTFNNLTVRNETVRSALLGDETDTRTGDVTVESATLENLTVDGFAVTHGTLGNLSVVSVRLQGQEEANGTEDETVTMEDPAVESEHLMIENGTVDDVAAVELAVGNETTETTSTNETTADVDTAENETTEEGGEQ